MSLEFFKRAIGKIVGDRFQTVVDQYVDRAGGEDFLGGGVHAVGLAHVDDDRELMYPEARRTVTEFAAGDLTGLAALGRGPCVPEL